MSFEPRRLNLCYHQSINLQSQVLFLPCVSIIIASESGIIRLISQEALLSLVTSSRASDDMDRGLKKIREACIAAATSDMCALLEDLCRAHFVNHSSLDNRWAAKIFRSSAREPRWQHRPCTLPRVLQAHICKVHLFNVGFFYQTMNWYSSGKAYMNFRCGISRPTLVFVFQTLQSSWEKSYTHSELYGSRLIRVTS